MKRLFLILICVSIFPLIAHSAKASKVNFMKLSNKSLKTTGGGDLEAQIFNQLKGTKKLNAKYNGYNFSATIIDGYICQCNDAEYTIVPKSAIKNSRVKDATKMSVSIVDLLLTDAWGHLCVEKPYPDKGKYKCLFYQEDEFSETMVLCQPNS